MNIVIKDMAGMVYKYEGVEDHGIFGGMYVMLIDGEEIDHIYKNIVSIKRF